MKRFTPLHGILVVVLLSLVLLGAEYVLEGNYRLSDYERVSPRQDGSVRISVAGLAPQEVRFFHFLNPANQEVRFFVGRDAAGHLQVAFDANQICAKSKRGYRAEGDWVVCNKCDKAFRLEEVNDGGGGCKPVPLEFLERGEEVVLTEAGILKGWRYFR